MFTARWRWNATRALAVLRFAGGRKVPPPLQRMRSDDLLAAVFPDQVACPENLESDIRIPDHPLVFETIRDCLHEAMDLDGLRDVLRGIESGAIRTVAIDTAEPSPFSHEILNANPYAYLDDAPLEERRTRAVQMRRSLGEDAAQIGALDPAAIAEVEADAWPIVRDADELHDALLTLGILPPVPDWGRWFDELSAARRATALQVTGRRLWVAAERLDLAAAAYPDGRLEPAIASVKAGRLVADRDAAVAEILRGWLESTGPTTASGFAARACLSGDVVERALVQLESEGQVLRGRFTPSSLVPDAEIEWCNRRLLARIHRLTLGRLRREIDPVTAADFATFLSRWQHVAPGTQLHGVDGLLQIVRQLQGYEVSAGAWESQVLSARVANYGPELLDRLCLSGEVMWARLSPPSQSWEGASDDTPPPASRRRRPTRVAPLAIFLRHDADWLLSLSAAEAGAPASPTGPAAHVLAELERRGALFASEIARVTGLADADVEDALWELAATGLVTADGFENLRGLLWFHARPAARPGRRGGSRRAAGRWSPLRRELGAHPVGSRVEAVEAFARQILLRWGVVFRDLMAREGLAPPWRDLLVALRRLEARGEIRGGRFVAGFVGEQFARPEAVDLLRAARRAAPADAIEVPAADPLNLAGIVLPGPRVSPLGGGRVALSSGAIGAGGAGGSMGAVR
jgi:ATP-dependent Lhr-like helicase